MGLISNVLTGAASVRSTSAGLQIVLEVMDGKGNALIQCEQIVGRRVIRSGMEGTAGANSGGGAYTWSTTLGGKRGGFPSTSTGETWLGEGELPVESVGVLLLTSASAPHRARLWRLINVAYGITHFPNVSARPVTQLGDTSSRLAELDLYIQPALRRMNLRPDGRP